jgi:hypothetical protein
MRKEIGRTEMNERTMIVALHQKHTYQVQRSNVNKPMRRKERRKKKKKELADMTGLTYKKNIRRC